MSEWFHSAWIALIQYETPRLVKIHNRKVGLVRRLIQFGIILYVGLYALYLQKGYQEFGNVESSVTTKIKGVIRSELDPNSEDDPHAIHKDLPQILSLQGQKWRSRLKELYTRIWDEADYVIPPAENGAFFVATNVIITPNQTRDFCPEDNVDVKGVTCEMNEFDCDYFDGSTKLPTDVPAPSSPVPKDIISTTEEPVSSDNDTASVYDNSDYWLANETSQASVDNGTSVDSEVNWSSSSTHAPDLSSASTTTFRPLLRRKCRAQSNGCPKGHLIYKAHGPLTGYCIPSDRPSSPPGVHACEVESWCPIEIDRLPLGKTRALMANAADYTVFVKNSVAFPYFGLEYVRNNLIANGGRPCLFKKDSPDPGCQIFRLGDIVEFAGGNFSQMAIKGGVVSLSIAWHCNLDYNFMKYCLPKYSFRILDDFGWNFRHAKYHEEHRRSLYKMYGIKFIITVEGRGGKFNLKNTILNIGSGLALLGVTTIICDFLLLYVKERRVVKQKKYDYVTTETQKTHNSQKSGTATNAIGGEFSNPNFQSVQENGENSTMLPPLNRECSTLSSLAPLASMEHIELHS